MSTRDPRRARLAALLAVLALLLALLAWLRTPPLPAVPPVAAEPRARPAPAAPVPPAPVARADLLATDDPPDPEPFRLDNGVTVFVLPDRSARTVAARVVVRAGAVDDPDGADGSAHLLEHVLFGGTERLGVLDPRREAPHLAAQRDLAARLAVAASEDRFALEDALADEHRLATRHAVPNETFRALDALGATGVNAWTSLEYTVFAALLPANALRPWAELEADRLRAPVLRTFVPERAVVENELAWRSACTSSDVAEALREAVFPGHPYGRPIGGTTETLAATTPDALAQFHRRLYAPENVAVVLVGDVAIPEALAVLADTFGRLPSRTVPRRRDVPAPAPLHARVVVPIPDRMLRMRWPLRDPEPDDVEALRVAGAVLAGMARRKAWMLPEVSVLELGRGGVFAFDASCFDAPACEQAVRSALAELRRDGVGEEALEVARVRAWVDRLTALESQEVQADAVARAWALGQPPDTLWRRVGRLRDLDTAAVADAVRRHLLPDRYAVGEADLDASRPPARERTLDPEDLLRSSAFFDALVSMPLPDLEPGWREEGYEWTRTSDGRVIAVANPSNTLFTATLSWPVGWSTDPRLCAALDRWKTASRFESARDWDRALRRVGVSLDVACTADRAEVKVGGPGGAAPEVLPLVLARLREPRLGSVAGRRGSETAARAREEGAERLALYGDAARPAPTAAELDASAATWEEALRLLGTLTPDVHYAGPHRAGEVAAMVPGARSWPDPAPPVEVRSRPRLLYVGGRGIATVTALRPGEPYDPAHEGLYALYDEWLTGTGGVAFERLRAVGAAYGVSASYGRGTSPGAPNVARVRAQGRDAAGIAAVVLGALSTSDVSPDAWDRVARAADAHAWSDVVPFRRAAAPIAAALDRGLPLPVQPVAWEQLALVDGRAFEDFLAREATAAPTLVVSGYASLDALRQLGEVVLIAEEGG